MLLFGWDKVCHKCHKIRDIELAAKESNSPERLESMDEAIRIFQEKW